MQYLLTQQELDALVPRTEVEALARDKHTMSKMIAKLTLGRCIHDPESGGGYCDGCGMAGLENDMPRCPFPRSFSK